MENTSVFTVGLLRIAVPIVLGIALLQRQQGMIILSLLLVLLFNGARLWSRFSRVRLVWDMKAGKTKLFPGERVTVEASAENRKLLPVWLRVQVPADGFEGLADGEKALQGESSLLWYEKVSWFWEIAAERRGLHPLGPPAVTTGDLFGFFSSGYTMKNGLLLVVYPRLVPIRRFAVQLRDYFGLRAVQSPVEDPVAPVGVRDYQHGRLARYIHWKASARKNFLQEKVFTATGQLKMMLLIDVNGFTGSEAEEDFERMLEIAASLAVELDQQGIPVGLAVNGEVEGAPPLVPVGLGPEKTTALLEVLARLRPKLQGKMEQVIRRSLRFTGGTSCVFLCRAMDPEAVAAGQYLRRQCRIPVVFITCLPDGERGSEEQKVFRLEQIFVGKVGGKSA